MTKADLARKFGISRARVTQVMNLLKLPEELIREVGEIGEYWERRFGTERIFLERVSTAGIRKELSNSKIKGLLLGTS